MTRLNFLKASWPPALVCIFYLFVAQTNQHQKLDWLMHLLGGISITFFFYQILNVSKISNDKLKSSSHYTLSFLLACAVALLWEVAEYSLLKATDINSQMSYTETMMDLIFGIAGALISIILIFIYKCFSKPTKS